MPVKLLNEDIENLIEELFNAQLVHPVEIYFFSKDDPCESCEDTLRLLEEVTSISDKIHLSTFNLSDNPHLARKYKVELAPGLVITGRDGNDLLDYGLQFAGIPSGYEFSSLIQGIILVSRRDSGLKPEIRKELQGITNPVNLKVFVTPT